MTLCLQRARPAPVVVDLGGGASVTVWPLDTIEHETAQADAARIMEALREGQEALAGLGIDVPAALADDVSRLGLAGYVGQVAVATRAITAWTGIGDEAGTPIEPDATTIPLLMRDPALARKITGRALAEVHRIADEGKGSATSPNGARGVAEASAPVVG